MCGCFNRTIHTGWACQAGHIELEVSIDTGLMEKKTMRASERNI